MYTKGENVLVRFGASCGYRSRFPNWKQGKIVDVVQYSNGNVKYYVVEVNGETYQRVPCEVCKKAIVR